MADVLTFLTSITLVLLAGIVSIYTSKKFKLPLSLILLFSGMILGNLFFYEKPVVELGGMFLAVFSIIALVFILFDSTSKIKFHSLDRSMKDSALYFAIALIINIIAFSYLTVNVLGFRLYSGIIFALLISCIEYLSVFPRNHIPNNKIAQFVKDESAISCAFILFIPFLIISFAQVLEPVNSSSLFSKLIYLATNLFAGIGIGLILSLIVFNLINKTKLENSASFIIGAGLLLAFLTAQKIGGNGFAAVAAMGFIFGNIFVKQKALIKKHEDAVYSILDIFVFIIAGLLIQIPFTVYFLKISVCFFLVYLLIRLLASFVTLKGYDLYERLEVALFVPKGLATITVAFALLNFSFSGVITMTRLLLAFFIYSMVLDVILDKVGFFKHR